MSPKKRLIPGVILILTILTTLNVSAQRGVHYSGGGHLPHNYGGGGARFYGGGHYYGGGRYYGGWGGYRGWGGLSFGLGLGFGPGYYGGFGLSYGYPYGYPYAPYYYPYAYPPVYAQPPLVVQQDQDTPDDPYGDDNSNYNPPRKQQQMPPPPQDEDINDNRPVNPDSLTYKPGTNLSSPRRSYSTRDKVWVKPHWKHTGDGWIWIDGYWK